MRLRYILALFVILLISTVLLAFSIPAPAPEEVTTEEITTELEIIEDVVTEPLVDIPDVEPEPIFVDPMTETLPEPEITTEPVVEPKPEVTTVQNREKEVVELSDEDIDLIALVTMAEAEGESEEGKRLVIDTILNRMDHKYWPDTAYEVIYQPHQFTSMWNGRVDRCYVREDIVELVKEELESRTNYDCVFFRMDHYSKYGKPMFQVGCHYFSSYE